MLLLLLICVYNLFALQLTDQQPAKDISLGQIPVGRFINCFVRVTHFTSKFFRFGVPHDISGVVTFLASDDAGYITGETIVAAGGMASRL